MKLWIEGIAGKIPALPGIAPGLLAAEQRGLLRLIFGVRDRSGILRLLQINQLLSDGGRLSLGCAAAAQLEI